MILLSNLKNNFALYLGGIIILIILLYEAQGEGDFNIFISASNDLLQGKNIYKIQYNQWFHYYYNVLFALVLVPFTYLPLYVTKLCWLLINVFFVYRIWQVLISWLPLNLLNKTSKQLFIALSFIVIARFLRDNFHLAQMTIFILYLCLEGLYLIEKNKVIAGSFLIALGIDIKLLPIIIVPYLIYRAEWKALLFTIFFVVVFLFLPSIFIGYEYNNFLLSERWLLINPTNKEHILDTSERSFHSLTTLLTTLLVKNCGDTYALTIKRNIADISIDKLNLIINMIRGFLILLTLYFLRTKPFCKQNIKIFKLYEIAYLCLIVPLIFPHQQHYSFFFIFPATTYLVFYYIYIFNNCKPNKAKKAGLIILFFAVYFLTNSHFILGHFNYLYDHFKTLTYGTMLLLVLLAICNPQKMNIKKELL